MKKVTEDDVKGYLKDWLRKKGWEVSETQVQLPPMKYRDKTNKPDIFAYKKRANTICLIECKRATRLRYIGHAFGQILTTRLTFGKMKKTELEKKLMETTGRKRLDDLKLEFGVAFPEEQVNAYKSIQRMITMFHKLPQFEEFTVYLVRSEDRVKRKPKGHPIPYVELMRRKSLDS